MSEQELELRPYYRSLGEKTFFVKFGYIRLTEWDAGAAIMVFMGLFVIMGLLPAIGSLKIFFIRLDPWLAVIAGSLVLLAACIIHEVDEEKDLGSFVMGFFEPKKYSALTKGGDRKWFPKRRPWLLDRGTYWLK